MHYKTAAGIQKIAGILRELRKVAEEKPAEGGSEITEPQRPTMPAELLNGVRYNRKLRALKGAERRAFRNRQEDLNEQYRKALDKYNADRRRYLELTALKGSIERAKRDHSVWDYLNPANIFGPHAKERRTALENRERLMNTDIKNNEIVAVDPEKKWATPEWRSMVDSDIHSAWPWIDPAVADMLHRETGQDITAPPIGFGLGGYDPNAIRPWNR